SETNREYYSPVLWWDRGRSSSLAMHREPLWREYLRQRLEAMSATRSVGYPSRDTLSAAWHVANHLLDPSTPTPSVVPGEDACVELVWRRGGWHVELEIGPDRTYVWARERSSDEVVCGDLDD